MSHSTAEHVFGGVWRGICGERYSLLIPVNLTFALHLVFTVLKIYSSRIAEPT